jgi:uncharacterized protein (TIGR02453 family)
VSKPKARRFEGFPPRGLRFLAELEKHNDRTWFAPRKAVYEETLLLPLRALVDELSDRFARKRIPVFGDERRSIFRIYRDVRFTHDKRPYKTHVSAYLSPDGGRRTPGGMYLHLSPSESFIGVAFYQIDKALLTRWRTAMAERPQDFLRVIRDLKRARLQLQAPEEQEDALARLPRGFTHLADTPLAPYFRLRHFIIHEDLARADLGSRKLLDRSVRFVERAIPLLAYGWRLASELQSAELESLEAD